MSQITQHLQSFLIIPYRILVFFFSISTCVLPSVVHTLPASESLCEPMEEANSGPYPNLVRIPVDGILLFACSKIYTSDSDAQSSLRPLSYTFHAFALLVSFWNALSLNLCRNSTHPSRLSLNVISSIKTSLSYFLLSKQT